MKVSTNDINLKEILIVEGKVKFSRIASFIEGKELEEDIQRQKSFSGRAFITTPYNRLQISNAKIIKAERNKNIPTNEKGVTNGQLYLHQKFYKSKKNPDTKDGYLYTAINKGKILPRTYVKTKNGKFEEIVLEGELAQGTPVRICHNVYEGAMSNNGIGIIGIFILDPDFKYYSSNQDQILKDLGLDIISLSNKEIEEKREKAKEKIEQSEKPTEENISDDFAEESDENPFLTMDTTVNSELNYDGYSIEEDENRNY